MVFVKKFNRPRKTPENLEKSRVMPLARNSKISYEIKSRVIYLVSCWDVWTLDHYGRYRINKKRGRKV